MPRRAVSQAIPAVHAKHPRIDQHIRGQIVSGKWTAGVQIPTYDQLEVQFSVSRVTVMEAIMRLKADGFLISGGPRGVFVADVLPHIHNIGVVFKDDPENPASWSSFSHYVLEATRRVMQDRPGKIITYHGVRNSSPSEGYQMLLADLKAHRLGNLLLVHTGGQLMKTAVMEQKNIARVMIAATQPVPNVPSIYIDPLDFINKSLAHLKQQNVKRVAILIGGDGDPANPVFTTWRDRIAAHGMITQERWFQHVSLSHKRWANNITQAVLSAPADQRPDGMIITDDHYVEFATAGVLASQLSKTVPLHIVAYTNFPWPTSAAVPVTRMGLDVPALVRESFKLFDDQRAGQACPPAIRLPVITQAIGAD